MAELVAFDIAKGLLSELSSPDLQQLGLWWNFKDDFEYLKSTISSIKDVLLEAEEQSVTSNLVQDWLAKLKDVLYDTEDWLDDVRTEALRKKLMSGNKLTKEVRVFFSRSNQFAYGLKMGCRIRTIKGRFTSIQSQTHSFVSEGEIIGRNNYKAALLKLLDHALETSFMANRRRETHSFVSDGEIIGREDDLEAILRLLFEETGKWVTIVPIVGIGGLGKTALAQLVYNDSRVRNHFDLRMWVCVSSFFDLKVIVGNIIKSITDQVADQNFEMDQLQKELRNKIKGKRYLLVLDDIWNEDREQWFNLKKLLMGGAYGSRIIVTTRSRRVAKITSKCQPYELRGLSDVHAWYLFKEIAFEQRDVYQREVDSTNSAFVKIGKQILEKCDGIPLVIKTTAGILSFKETENEWLSFKDNLLSRISEHGGEILSTLKLSYDHLPSHLKHCFAYCRLYPKGHIIYVQELVQLWIAQGFTKQANPYQSPEEIGFGYFKSLVERSFFQEVEEDGVGGMRCKMQDLMHDLAELVAGKESSILDSNSSACEVNEKCRHVAIDFSLISLFKGKKLRTLLHFPNKKYENMSDATWNSIISNCRCLRVLKLDDLTVKRIPDSIRKLKHLRYLDLCRNENLEMLPKSICKTQNLQVLKLDGCYQLEELPKKIEKLVNLTHLECDGCWGLTHMPRGIGKLTLLQTLSMFVVDKDGSHGRAAANLSELSGLNNLRGRLRITNLGFVRYAREEFRAANLKEKQHLRRLELLWSGTIPRAGEEDDEEKSLEDLQPHPNLKELHVRGWRGDAKFPSWLSLLTNLVHVVIVGPSTFKHLPSFALLPHLQRLDISELTELEYMEDNGPDGGQGEPESFFPSLMYLRLVKCPNMRRWWRKSPVHDGEDDDKDRTAVGVSTMAFPCLSFLWIEDCPLSSMPLYPSLAGGLTLVNTSSRPLKQTVQMSSTYIFSLPLSKLKWLYLDNVEELDQNTMVWCLQNLTCLERLDIASCHWLKSLFGWPRQMTDLTCLTIRDCRKLDFEGMHWKPLRNLTDLEIDEIPQLVSLPLWLQHLFQLKSLVIKNCSGLRSLFPGFHHLTSLKDFKVINCKELELSADGFQIFQDYTSLRSLQLENIPKCRHLPVWLQHLPNLRIFVLSDLPNLTLFPDKMQWLTSLEELHMRDIHQLPDWNKIAHIPRIWVNEVQVQ